MTRSAGIRAVLAVAAACIPLAGCGGDDVGDPIPPARATAMERQLDAIQDDIDQGLCDDAARRIAALRVGVDRLDDRGVGSDVQDALGDGVDNLGDLAAAECALEEEPIETTPETVPEPTIPETTPEPTTPEPTTPEPTTPVPQPEPEPDEDDGSSQFDPDADLPPGLKKKQKDDD